MIDSDDLDRIVQDLMGAHDALGATVQPLAAGGAAVLLEGGQLFLVHEDLTVNEVLMGALCDCPAGRTIDGVFWPPEREPDCLVHGEGNLFELRERALVAC